MNRNEIERASVFSDSPCASFHIQISREIIAGI